MKQEKNPEWERFYSFYLTYAVLLVRAIEECVEEPVIDKISSRHFDLIKEFHEKQGQV